MDQVWSYAETYIERCTAETVLFVGVVRPERGLTKTELWKTEVDMGNKGLVLFESYDDAHRFTALFRSEAMCDIVTIKHD